MVQQATDPYISGYDEESSNVDVAFRGKTASSLKSLLPQPLLMTGIFREILVRHFADPSFIATPELAHLVWKTGETSPILIESVHRWVPASTERRPAVIVKRNAYSNRRVGIGDRLMMPLLSSNGAAHYATFWVGSHTLFCIGGSGAQAELLGAEVQRELHHFAPVFQRALNLHKLQVVDVGGVSEVEEAQENFVVPITIGYAFEDLWVIRQESPTLRRISLSYILDC